MPVLECTYEIVNAVLNLYILSVKVDLISFYMSSNMKLCYVMCAFCDSIGKQLSEKEFLESLYGAMGSTLKMLGHFKLYEFAVKHGYMEVLPYMCASDHLVAQAFHEHLIRHKRISDGDETCEYCYVGDKSEAARNDIGSK